MSLSSQLEFDTALTAIHKIGKCENVKDNGAINKMVNDNQGGKELEARFHFEKKDHRDL